MADVVINKFTTQILRDGATPSSPGFVVSEGQDPVNPPGTNNFVPYSGATGTVDLGAQTIEAGSFVKDGGTSSQFLKADGSVDSTAYGTGSVTSVALSMPSAFSVAGSPITTAGTLAVTGAGTVGQYIRGDGSLATFPALTGFVPYTGATADVNLGTHDLAAERGTFTNNGSSDTLTVNHTSGSGYGIIVTKGGANEALYVSKTSGSGNAMTVVGGRTSLVDLALSSVTNTAGDFLTLSGGVVHKRTAAETLTDIGGQAALTNPVTGTGTTNYLPKFTGASTIGNSQVFDNGTNVGIGTSSPISYADKTLQLNNPSTNSAYIKITNSTTGDGVADGLDIGNFGLDAYIWNRENGATVFATNSTERMRIWGSTGNVNIGPTPSSDAGYKLDVNGQSRFKGNDYHTFQVNDGSAQIRLERLNSSTGLAYLGADSTGFSVFNSSFTRQLTIASTGAATFSSSVQSTGLLSRIQAAGSDGYIAYLTAGVQNTVMGFNNSGSTNTQGVLNNYSYFGNLNAYGLQFTTNGAVVATITSGGNVGIGTTSPSQLLTLGGTASPQLSIVSSTTTGSSEIYFGDSAAVYRGAILYDHTSDYLTLHAGAGERLRINSNGNVLIGTTTDNGAKLQVNGTLSLSVSTATGKSLSGVYFPIVINGTTYYLPIYA
jgi:hypothetical protein